MSVAVVVPVYNEELTVERTVRDLCAHVPDARIVVVDNASTDATPALIGELADAFDQVEVLTEPRKGKGLAVRTAFNTVDADVYVLIDGDCTYDASDAPRLIELLRISGAEMVVGDRRAEGRYDAENQRSFHQLGNRLVIGLVNRLYGVQLNDVMSGYRVLSRRLVDVYPLLVDGFELETDLTMFALDRRMRIVETPSRYRDRPEGSESKLDTFRDGGRVVRAIWRLCRIYRPLLFFGALSGVLALLSVLAGLPSIIEYVQTGVVLRFPLAFLAVGFGVLSALSLAVGLTLDSLRHQALAAVELHQRRSRRHE